MVAVATPCWPAPVSAITRFLPIRLTKQPLPHDVIGLMGTGMVQVFPLDVDPGSAQMVGEVFSKGQRSGTTGIITHQVDVLLPKPASARIAL